MVKLCLLTLVTLCQSRGDDYWNDDYDETRNCKEEETIETLIRAETPRCAEVQGRGRQHRKSMRKY